MAQYADMPSTSSSSMKVECTDDLTFDLPADLLDLSLEPPYELDPIRLRIDSFMMTPRSSRGRDLKTTVRYKSEGLKDDDTTVDSTVVAACERRPFRGPTEDFIGEMPQFEDLYQMIREVMENHVPAALGDCELWLLKRLLWTLGNMIKTLDLDATKKDLHEALLWAAAQPPDGYSKPAGQDNEQPQVPPTGDSARRSLNFPSMKERKDGLRSSWNPLRMPTSAVQRPWAMIRDYLASKPSRRACVKMEGPSTSTATGATASALASRKKKTTTTTMYEPGTLDAFRAWKN
ncbi:hypothetical protein HPB50_024432 [Hyalomma asiaticum]|uniref:Uncharacterized protein n=1 Tax=Hyalomma asiaticum TaxID=266040 RepID=A0ACB7S579_HYAAI|nr:hypothetical protein HPB50_024432 [Hyalomma asiaticum]